VLTAVQLKPAIRAAGGLHVKMAEAGENLSVGQRQLFCLARWVSWKFCWGGGLLQVDTFTAKRCSLNQDFTCVGPTEGLICGWGLLGLAAFFAGIVPGWEIA
jgi:hypothetical protein